MNKFSIMTKSLIAMSLVGIAYADNDFSHSSLAESWTGLYAGLNAGFAFNDVQLNSQQLGFTNPSQKCDMDSDFSSFFPGIQLGYMHQFSNRFVSGIEANFTVNTNQKDTLDCICPDNVDVSDSFSFKNKMQGSIKGRMGHALNWNKEILLPYITAGVSFADLELAYNNEGGDHYSNNTTQAGWLIGAGIEWAIKQNWSLRAEYSYIDYGNAINLDIPSVYGLVDPEGNASADLNSNNITVAVNYWF